MLQNKHLVLQQQLSLIFFCDRALWRLIWISSHMTVNANPLSTVINKSSQRTYQRMRVREQALSNKSKLHSLWHNMAFPLAHFSKHSIISSTSIQLTAEYTGDLSTSGEWKTSFYFQSHWCASIESKLHLQQFSKYDSSLNSPNIHVQRGTTGNMMQILDLMWKWKWKQ